jgi:hypothetical protein
MVVEGRTEAMHAPNHATQVTAPARHDFYAGVCQSGCPFNGANGWFVPYRRVRDFHDAYEAVINLHVLDLSSTFMCVMPFLIDTGSDATIIPRHFLRPGAFEKKSAGPSDVKGISGNRIFGKRFRAAMHIPLLRHGPEPLSFGELEVMVVEQRMDYGVLGLNALRRVLMVSDREHVSFWPSPTGTCAAD